MSSINLNLEENNRAIIFYDELNDKVQMLGQFCGSKTLTKTLQQTFDNMDQNVDDLSSSIDVCFMMVKDISKLSMVQLCLVTKILKPDGRLFIMAPSGSTLENLRSAFTLSGFIHPEATEVRNSTQNEWFGIHDGAIITAKKPSYEIGTSVPIKFNQASSKHIWKLSANDMMDDDLMDSDSILDQQDFAKPDPVSLKGACATTGKRQACKNCTCGLAEELEKEVGLKLDKPINADISKSACGNCYLGDAFRCASCPYMGMPAFKPGDKIKLPM